jgi:hypothetical protein
MLPHQLHLNVGGQESQERKLGVLFNQYSTPCPHFLDGSQLVCV